MESLLSEDGTLSMEVLTATGAEFKWGASKNCAIIRGSMAIVSLIASSMLIRMIMTSKQRLTTTYHRLMLGMTTGDILLSAAFGTFQVMTPKDMNYLVWNARGNAATCDLSGFVAVTGVMLIWFYSCSLNLYFLFKVKYNISDEVIRNKIEPFLHGVPILMALIWSSFQLVNKNYNDNGLGICANQLTYAPPHCVGYQDGEIREGFTVPCGRGDNERAVYLVITIFLFIPPVVIGASLAMLYRTVSKQEKKMSRYGESSLEVSSSSNNTKTKSNSRAILHRAAAYSFSYTMAFVWPIIMNILDLAQVEWKGTKPGLILGYLWNILSLEGFFNLLIFIHPRVVTAKRNKGSNLSWCGAFASVLWLGISGRETKQLQTKTFRRSITTLFRFDLRRCESPDIKIEGPHNEIDSTNVSSDRHCSSEYPEEEKTEIKPRAEIDDSVEHTQVDDKKADLEGGRRSSLAATLNRSMRTCGLLDDSNNE